MSKNTVELDAIDDIEIVIDDGTEAPEVTPPDDDEIVISTPEKKTPAKKPTNAPQATKADSGPKSQATPKSSTTIPTVETDDDLPFTMDVETAPKGKIVESVVNPANAIDADLFESILAVEDVVANPTFLIYGKNGTGKTTMLSTAEGVLILVTDDGTMSIRNKTDKTRTRRLKIEDWHQVEKLYFALKRGKVDKSGTGIWLDLPDGPFCVRYVAFDTITKLAQLCLRAVALNDASDVTKDIVKKTIRDWGDMSDRMKHWMGLYKELPIYNVWMFQEQTNTENTEDEEYSVMPAVNQSLRVFFQSEADVIGRTMIKRGRNADGNPVTAYCLVVGGLPNVVTKDRTNVLKATMVNPSLTKMVDAIKA